MTNTRAKSTWNDGDLVTPAQITTIDQGQTNSLDRINGDGYVTGGGIVDTIDVMAGGAFRLVNSSGTALVTLSGSTLDIKSSGTLLTDSGSTTTIGGTFTANGTANLNGLINLNGGVASNVTFNNGFTVTTGNVIFDAGSLISGLFYTSVSKSSNYNMADTDSVILVDTSSVSVIITLVAPGTNAGRVVHILNDSVGGGNTLTISTPSGLIWYNGSLSVSSHAFTAGVVTKCSLFSDGTNWRFMSYVAGI